MLVQVLTMTINFWCSRIFFLIFKVRWFFVSQEIFVTAATGIKHRRFWFIDLSSRMISQVLLINDMRESGKLAEWIKANWANRIEKIKQIELHSTANQANWANLSLICWANRTNIMNIWINIHPICTNRTNIYLYIRNICPNLPDASVIHKIRLMELIYELSESRIKSN